MKTKLHLTQMAIVFLIACAIQPNAVGENRNDGTTPNFNRDIQPILASACFNCHGPDENEREADLRFDVADGVEAAFGGGDLDDSEAWRRIVSDDESERMPPPESDHQLTDDERDLLRRWIESGAEWQSHWSFIPPARSKLQPEQKAQPIDFFLSRSIQAARLQTTSPADPARMLRRVTFDLTGLPPTLEELDAFLADHSDNAYEKAVDRLLASPRFGERMAVAWLDAARYGDTSVFHGDGHRDMWAWRDWVINAYNSNKPFDQFTVEQLAGDLIPNSTTEQKIASAFNRNNATTDEGGAIAEEFRVEYAVDRVKTTSMVWLGLTMECAQCHDHKYDPVSQEEYYKFFAYFNQSADKGMQTRNGNAAPMIDVPNYENKARLATIRTEVKRAQADLDARRSAAEAEFQQWLATAASSDSVRDAAPSDMVAHFQLDEAAGSSVGDSVDAKRKGKIHGAANWTMGRFSGALRLNSKTYVDAGNVADFERDQGFSYGGWIKPAGNISGAPIARMHDSNGYRGFDLYLNGGHVGAHIIHNWPDNAIKVMSEKKLAKDKWQHVLITYDGKSKAAGVKVYVNGKPWKTKAEQDGLRDSIRNKVPLYLGRRNPGSHYTGELDDVRIFSRALTATEVEALAQQQLIIAPILAKTAEERTEKEVDTLRTHYLSQYDAIYQRLNADFRKLKTRETELTKPRGTIMVMKDLDKPRMTYVLSRGNYASPQKDRPVQPGVPMALSAMPEDAPANRLGLARWLVNSEHPLTARVAVNRYWMMFFGAGLVESVEDFGSQGTWPSHPELLDWLAVDFVDSGWDIKRMIKQMLMSDAYRRSTRVDTNSYQQDPQNRLLARGAAISIAGRVYPRFGPFHERFVDWQHWRPERQAVPAGWIVERSQHQYEPAIQTGPRRQVVSP